MGPRIVAKAKKSVSLALKEFEKLSAHPGVNLKRLNVLVSKLRNAQMTKKQHGRFLKAEQRVYSGLIKTKDRTALYTFPLSKGYKEVDVSGIKTAKKAMAALKVCARDPSAYLPQIQRLYHMYTSVASSIEMQKIMATLRRTSLVRSNFVRSRPIDIIPTRVEVLPTLRMRPRKEIDLDELEKAEEKHGKSGDALAVAGVRSSAGLVTTETRIGMAPEEHRIVGTPFKRPVMPVNDKYGQLFSPEIARKMQDAYTDMVMRNKPGEAGKIWFGGYSGWLNQGLDLKAMGLGVSPVANNTRDPRWNKMRVFIGPIDMSNTTKGLNDRKASLNIINALAKGDWGTAMDLLDKRGVKSPLSGVLEADISRIAKQTTAYIPVLFLSTRFATPLHPRKINIGSAKLTFFGRAGIDFIRSQKYHFEYDKTERKLRYVPDGYTFKQALVTVGGGARLEPWKFAEVKLDAAAEMPYGVDTETGDAVFIEAGKTQGVLSLSVQERSGRTAKYIKVPIYAGLRATWRVPSHSVNLGGRVGIGLPWLTTKTFGPFMVVADISGEVHPGKEEYPQPLANLVWSAGVAVEPARKWLEDLRLYYVQTKGGEPTGMGLKVDKTRGGGVELKTWRGIKIKGEVRERQASTILGIPLEKGKDNVYAIVQVDLAEFMRRIVQKKEE